MLKAASDMVLSREGCGRSVVKASKARKTVWTELMSSLGRKACNVVTEGVEESVKAGNGNSVSFTRRGPQAGGWDA